MLLTCFHPGSRGEPGHVFHQHVQVLPLPRAAVHRFDRCRAPPHPGLHGRALRLLSFIPHNCLSRIHRFRTGRIIVIFFPRYLRPRRATGAQRYLCFAILTFSGTPPLPLSLLALVRSVSSRYLIAGYDRRMGAPPTLLHSSRGC